MRGRAKALPLTLTITMLRWDDHEEPHLLQGDFKMTDLSKLADDALYCPCWNQTVSESCRGVCPFREAHGYVILVDQPIIDIDD